MTNTQENGWAKLGELLRRLREVGVLAQSTFARTQETVYSELDALAVKNPIFFMLLTHSKPSDYKQTRKLRTEYEDIKESLKQYKRQIREYSGRVCAFSAEALQTAPRLPGRDWEKKAAKIQRFVSKVDEEKTDFLPKASDTGIDKDRDIDVAIFVDIWKGALHRIPEDEPKRLDLASVAAYSAVTGNNVRRMSRLMRRGRDFINKRLNRLKAILTTAPDNPG